MVLIYGVYGAYLWGLWCLFMGSYGARLWGGLMVLVYGVLWYSFMGRAHGARLWGPMVLVYGEGLWCSFMGSYGARFTLTDKHHKNTLLQPAQPALGDYGQTREQKNGKRGHQGQRRNSDKRRDKRTATPCLECAAGECLRRIASQRTP